MEDKDSNIPKGHSQSLKSAQIPHEIENVPRGHARTMKTETKSRRSFLQKGTRKVSQIYEKASGIFSRMGGDNVVNEVLDEDAEVSLDKIKNTESLVVPQVDEGNSFTATLFVFIKVNLVAGFLFLPYGFSIGGWLFSIIALCFVSAFISFANISLAECTTSTGTYSFPDVGFKAIGKPGKIIVDIGIALSQICFPCSYINLTATVVNQLIQTWFHLTDNYYWYIAIAQLAILLPLCFIRKIAWFAKLHIVGDLSVLATVVALLYYSITKIVEMKDFSISNYDLIGSSWSKVLGMMIASLEGIGVVLPVKETMREKHRFNSIIVIGMSVVTFVLGAYPLVAYFSYNRKTPQIILTVLPFDEIYIQVVMILLVFSIIVVYPVQLYPAFRIIETNFFTCENRKTLWENLMRAGIVMLTIVIGILSIGSFENLMALAGSLVCTPVALILPTFFHYKIYKETQSTFRTFVDIFITCLGIAIGLLILIFTLINW